MNLKTNKPTKNFLYFQLCIWFPFQRSKFLSSKSKIMEKKARKGGREQTREKGEI